MRSVCFLSSKIRNISIRYTKAYCISKSQYTLCNMWVPYWCDMKAWNICTPGYLNVETSARYVRTWILEIWPPTHVRIPAPHYLPAMWLWTRDFISFLTHFLTCKMGSLRSYWEGNRQEGQGSPNGANRLQVSDIFISLKRQEETN